MKTVGNKIVVKRLEVEVKSPNGLIMPDSAKEVSQEGNVIAVGSKCESVKEGDKIIFSPYAGTEITISEEVVLVMNENDVNIIL